MINLIVADDQAMIRGALASLLDLEDDFNVVAQAKDGEDLLEQLLQLCTSKHAVDLVIMDVEMPKLDGLAACAAVRRKYPQTKVLVVTTFGRPGYVRRALESGASGFMVKDAPLAELADAIRKIYQGQQVIDPVLAVATLQRGSSPLTQRETDVLELLGAGRTLSDVAKYLGLSAGTVRNYASTAMEKTASETHMEAVRVAVENGWLNPGNG